MSAFAAAACTCCTTNPCACPPGSPWIAAAEGDDTYAVKLDVSASLAAPKGPPIASIFASYGGIPWVYFDGQENPGDRFPYYRPTGETDEQRAAAYCDEIVPQLFNQGGRVWTASGSPSFADLSQLQFDEINDYKISCRPVAKVKCETIGWQHDKWYNSHDGSGITVLPNLPGELVPDKCRTFLGMACVIERDYRDGVYGYRIWATGYAKFYITCHVASRPWTDWFFVKYGHKYDFVDNDGDGRFHGYPDDYDPHKNYGPGNLSGIYEVCWFSGERFLTDAEFCGSTSISVDNTAQAGYYGGFGYNAYAGTSVYPCANNPDLFFQGKSTDADTKGGGYAFCVANGGSMTLSLERCPGDVELSSESSQSKSSASSSSSSSSSADSSSSSSRSSSSVSVSDDSEDRNSNQEGSESGGNLLNSHSSGSSRSSRSSESSSSHSSNYYGGFSESDGGEPDPFSSPSSVTASNPDESSLSSFSSSSSIDSSSSSSRSSRSSNSSSSESSVVDISSPSSRSSHSSHSSHSSESSHSSHSSPSSNSSSSDSATCCATYRVSISGECHDGEAAAVNGTWDLTRYLSSGGDYRWRYVDPFSSFGIELYFGPGGQWYLVDYYGGLQMTNPSTAPCPPSTGWISTNPESCNHSIDSLVCLGADSSSSSSSSSHSSPSSSSSGVGDTCPCPRVTVYACPELPTITATSQPGGETCDYQGVADGGYAATIGYNDENHVWVLIFESYVAGPWQIRASRPVESGPIGVYTVDQPDADAPCQPATIVVTCVGVDDNSSSSSQSSQSGADNSSSSSSGICRMSGTCYHGPIQDSTGTTVAANESTLTTRCKIYQQTCVDIGSGTSGHFIASGLDYLWHTTTGTPSASLAPATCNCPDAINQYVIVTRVDAYIDD